MPKRKDQGEKQRLVNTTVALTPEALAFVQKVAAEQYRTTSQQLRLMIMDWISQQQGA